MGGALLGGPRSNRKALNSCSAARFSYRKPPKMRRLTKSEISFLRWLRDQGGTCALSESGECAKYYRLVKAGHVEMQLPDRFNPAVLNFKLTESGQGILEAAERQQSVRDSPTRLRPR